MCGLCVETRRSSTHTLPGDYSTSLPLAQSRSSKTPCAHKHSQLGREHAVSDQALRLEQGGRRSLEEDTRGEMRLVHDRNTEE